MQLHERGFELQLDLGGLAGGGGREAANNAAPFERSHAAPRQCHGSGFDVCPAQHGVSQRRLRAKVDKCKALRTGEAGRACLPWRVPRLSQPSARASLGSALPTRSTREP